MILSFKCDATKKIYSGEKTPDLPPDIQKVALRKLQQLDIALVLSDLSVPPGNKLEALKRDRVGQHAIRINSKWRICFVWNKNNTVEDVEIVDYH